MKLSWRRKTLTPDEEKQEQFELEHLEFLSDEDRQLFLDARLGVESAEFWNSDVGLYLRGCCSNELKVATSILTNAAPTDHAAIAKAQVQLRAAQLLARWITSAIETGTAAEDEMRHREEHRNG